MEGFKMMTIIGGIKLKGKEIRQTIKRRRMCEKKSIETRIKH